jgi:hypothetical protein
MILYVSSCSDEGTADKYHVSISELCPGSQGTIPGTGTNNLKANYVAPNISFNSDAHS